MTHSTDQRPAQADESALDDEHEDLVDHEAAQDDLDRPDAREVLPDPDEESAHRFLDEGPQGPQGRVEMAAAGIDVDRRFPADETDDHPGESLEGDADGHPSEAFVEAGNRWEGDGPVSTAGQLLTPDPSHPQHPDLVVAANPDATVESVVAAGLPVVREPLLTAEAEQAFLDQWNDIQVGFVEDPAQSVRSADTLIQDIAAAYTTAFTERREVLTAAWQEGNPGTEELRLALKQYRSFIGVVLPK